MSLARGTAVGSYEIVAPIGAGGMGEVYRARDTKLNRDVALKILPAAFATDPDRLARFRREAQTLAALNHPHIAAIYGIEESSSVSALVMELVDGEDLSLCIQRGPIPLDEAMPIARQIADALEAAHAQGIIHRDLKPANIKVRDDGTVKVLDFGLAKAIEAGGAGQAGGAGKEGLSLSPTLTTPAMMTGVGVVLGTAAYMSPEQAKGRAADARSDVWAFGCVLYEMLTGARPFEGEDVADTLAAVLRGAPDWTKLPEKTPPQIRLLLERCLEKDRHARVAHISTAQFLLTETIPSSAGPATGLATTSDLRRATRSRARPWIVAGVATIAAGALLIVLAPWRTQSPSNRPLVQLDVDLGADVSLMPPSSNGSTVAISPDGTRILYLTGPPARLFVRRLDQTKGAELPGTQGATAASFSPDGQWVAFFLRGRLNKISVNGGAMVPIGDPFTNAAGAAWSEDGRIIASEPFGRGLVRVPEAGGPAEIVAPLAAGEFALAAPQLLPGGNAVLVVADPAQGIDRNTIEVVTIADGKRKVVVRGGHSPHYVESTDGPGYLLYVNKTTLFAVAFDPKRLETKGSPVPILDDVAADPRFGVGQFDVSRTGTLVYRRHTGDASGAYVVKWVDASGTSEPLLTKPAQYADPRLSPDGGRLALSVREGSSPDIWVYDPRRDAMTRLTFGGGYYMSPVWTPDGQHVAFVSRGAGSFQARSDGSSQPQPLTESKQLQIPSSFAPDGRRLAFFEAGAINQIWTVAVEPQGGALKAAKPEPFLKSSFSDAGPVFSPDGKWLAYYSNESGRNEVYVRAFPPPPSGQGGKWQISNGRGTNPRWSPNGRALLYQAGDDIMSASYAANGNAFVADKPRVWLAKLGAVNVPNTTAWDLSPDGKRVVVVTPAGATSPKQEHEVVFLQNFVDELRRRMPVR